MSRYAGRNEYSEASVGARNEVVQALRAMITDSGQVMADVDRSTGWWPGRTSRITLPISGKETGAERYHTTLEDLFEIGRFLNMRPATVLSRMALSLKQDLANASTDTAPTVERSGPQTELRKFQIGDLVRHRASRESAVVCLDFDGYLQRHAPEADPEDLMVAGRPLYWLRWGLTPDAEGVIAEHELELIGSLSDE